LARQGGGGYGKRGKYYVFLNHVIVKLWVWIHAKKNI
jgi:hypothetical protein